MTELVEPLSDQHFDEGSYDEDRIHWTCAWSKGNVRQFFEDRFCCGEFFVDQIRYIYFVLMDGHGNSSTANTCRDHFPRILHAALKQFHEHSRSYALRNVSPAITYAFQAMQQYLYNHKTSIRGSGSTLSLVLFQRISPIVRRIYVANVGDSAVVGIQKRSNAAFHLLTENHRLDNKHEQKRLKQFEPEFKMDFQQGYLVKNGTDGIQVTRSLGDFIFAPAVIAEPSIMKVPDRAFPYLLMASDGLYDFVPDLSTLRPYLTHAKDMLAFRQAYFPQNDNCMILLIQTT